MLEFMHSHTSVIFQPNFDDPRYAFRAPLTDTQRDQLLFGNAKNFYGIA